ncbi:unnamed protein product [Lactuca virosa]|uniref:Patatin n=1 Tax=Lactuca virosa TaxID=75947 RepID=A0AAU9LTH6_9ASTR|nr:unnamed protein product [Lactuca virosa]
MEISKVTLEIFSKLEQQWLSQRESSKKTRVLSIDGGGTTGIPSGAALIHLEDQIQAKTGNSGSRIIDFFDIIAGTGIGALLAAMLNADDGNGRPRFTAREAVKFISDRNSELFKVKNVGVVHRRRMFSGKSMEKVLKEALTRDDGKVLTLKDTCKPLIVPCYDLNSSAPFVSPEPTPPNRLATTSISGKFAEPHRLIRQCSSHFISHQSTCVVGIVLDGVSETVDQILGNAFCWNHADYVRIQANGYLNGGVGPTVSMEKMLNERGVETLPFGGKRLMTETNGQRIETFVQRLVGSSLPPSPCKNTTVSQHVDGR